MKVLIINGSPKLDGNCASLIKEMSSVFSKENFDVELYNIAVKDIRGCIDCGSCRKTGRCAFEDDVNYLIDVLDQSDGLVLVSPVYYASANGTLIALLDRLFHASKIDKRMKVGAAFAVARRAGTTATFDQLNKYFTISQMPIASGRYWNNGFGGGKEEIREDLEGLQNARVVANNMVFLMKSIALGKKEYGLPEMEVVTPTNFIKK